MSLTYMTCVCYEYHDCFDSGYQSELNDLLNTLFIDSISNCVVMYLVFVCVHE